MRAYEKEVVGTFEAIFSEAKERFKDARLLEVGGTIEEV